MRVCVVGTGYVGLVTGACLAAVGHRVTGVDQDLAKLARLEAGELPLYEPGLEELVRMQQLAGTLDFTADLEGAIGHAEVVFITVGTPGLPTGAPDLTQVATVARAIGRALNGYKVIVNKSTVPVGSGDWVAMLVREGRAALAALGPRGLEDEDFDVVSNPEFLREGSAVADTFAPDRIVVGTHSGRAIAYLRELYAPILERPEGPVPFLVMDPTSAELLKYAANAFLATKISFINEIATLCERVGGDVRQVALGLGLDPRIGSSYLEAGLGWGGSCLPKDVDALIHMAHTYGYEAPLLHAVREVNERQLDRVIAKLQAHLQILRGKTICLLGLAFKPGTDDLRSAPPMALAAELMRQGVRVQAHDPVALGPAIARLPSLVGAEDPLEAARGADAVVLTTAWSTYQLLDLERLRTAVRTPLLLDARNALERAAAEAAGFVYTGMGR